MQEEEGGKNTPKLPKKDLLPILSFLKEKVLQLEDELKDTNLRVLGSLAGHQ